MKRMLVSILATIPLLTAVAMVVPARANAVDPVAGACKGKASGTAICEAGKDNKGSLVGDNGILTKIIQTFAYVAGIVAVVTGTVGGVRIAISNGDPGAIKAGKETVIYAIVGVVIAGFAQTIVIFVLKKL